MVPAILLWLALMFSAARLVAAAKPCNLRA